MSTRPLVLGKILNWSWYMGEKKNSLRSILINIHVKKIGMETFQKIVLFSALGVLVVCLIFIGLALSKTKNENWPPMISQCPDYWDASADAKGNTICTNTRNLGLASTNADCKQKKAADLDTDCAKYTYASNCGVMWDGITYGNVAPNPCVAASAVPGVK